MPASADRVAGRSGNSSCAHLTETPDKTAAITDASAGHCAEAEILPGFVDLRGSKLAQDLDEADTVPFAISRAWDALRTGGTLHPFSFCRDFPLRKQLRRAPLSHFAVWQKNSRERRVEMLGDFLVVVAHDADVFPTCSPRSFRAS
jgi:hypothetical protein